MLFVCSDFEKERGTWNERGRQREEDGVRKKEENGVREKGEEDGV